MRVATLAHGHPEISAGGAEIAAMALHEALQGVDGLSTLHIGCVPTTRVVAPQSRQRVVATGVLDTLRLVRRDPREHVPLLDLLSGFDPDVIHFHHVLGFGADALVALRQVYPGAVIVLTLHEYIAICHRQGQMVTTEGALCEISSPAACATCFPAIPAHSFLARAEALRRMLSLVDGFVAPSAFLARRYVAWGLPADRIVVLENVIATAHSLEATATAAARRNRFAFFGQLNSFKGVDLLLRAVSRTDATEWGDASLVIHGSGFERQAPSFQAEIIRLIAATEGRAILCGAYTNADMPRLLQTVDWVVVPSTWWENSPVVIQEAFRAGRPVIGANLGGVAEKVQHGIDGLLFDARDEISLAQTLQQAADPALWACLAAGITAPAAPGLTAGRHVEFYRSLLAARR